MPYDLKTIGASGCQLLVEPRLALPLSNLNGSTTLRARMTTDSRLIGLALYLQAWALDSQANALGVVVSDASEALIGAK